MSPFSCQLPVQSTSACDSLGASSLPTCYKVSPSCDNTSPTMCHVYQGLPPAYCHAHIPYATSVTCLLVLLCVPAAARRRIKQRNVRRHEEREISPPT
ncbi:hypothetical protein IQ06DRAFT_293149 [Phaeosphaeriaceae sp. SRC1lsM3a]|nr:hypothetical protein IQ06DRAFT_293149 [Stagonospora sp. SRC1lsM3a]